MIGDEQPSKHGRGRPDGVDRRRNPPLGCLTLGLDTQILEADAGAASLLGKSRAELERTSLDRLLSVAEAEELQRFIRLLRATPGAHRTHLTVYGWAAQARVLRLDGAMLPAPTIDPPRCRIALSDVSEHWRVEANLQEVDRRRESRMARRTEVLAAELAASEEQVRYQASLVDCIGDPMISTDLDQRVLSWNTAAEKMYGWPASRALGRIWSELVPTELQDATPETVREKLLRDGTWSGRARQQTRAGEPLYVSVSVTVARAAGAVPARAIALIRDETELHALRERFLQSQKLEAVGRLASGMAHDFNNLLMGISGCANMAARRLDDSHPAMELLEEIQNATAGGAAIVNRLLTFSRRRATGPGEANLDLVLPRFESILRSLLGEDVELRIKTETQGLRVGIGAAQVEQILMNLAVNARDAMPQGGTFEIRSALLRVDPTATGVTGVAPGVYANVSVSDTGCGMDQETLAYAFEPFFTTKGIGEGTGLGLSTVYGLVEESGGSIRAESAPDQGTTFVMLLPLLTGAACEDSAAPTPAPRRGNGELVLLVEDDHLVRMAARHYLEEGGYQVIDTDAPAQAIALCRDLTTPLDLVLTDIVLPKMSGRRMFAHVRSLMPSTRALFMSAHPREMLIRAGRITPDEALLEKPFSEHTLLARVHELLQ